MTIKRGEPWGERRVPPSDLERARSDAQAAALIAAGRREFLLTGGDMWRTIGGSPNADPATDEERTVVMLDSLMATFEQSSTVQQRPILSHAIFVTAPTHRARNRRWIVGKRASDRTYVMNAQFFGEWDVAPRSHPNDGRFEVMTISAAMPWGQRRQFQRRVLTGTHLPHPQIETRSVSQSWSPVDSGHLTLDGVAIGEVENLTIVMMPDSLTVWI